MSKKPSVVSEANAQPFVDNRVYANQQRQPEPTDQQLRDTVMSGETANFGGADYNQIPDRFSLELE